MPFLCMRSSRLKMKSLSVYVLIDDRYPKARDEKPPTGITHGLGLICTCRTRKPTNFQLDYSTLDTSEAIFRRYATKNLEASDEGGAIPTDDDNLAGRPRHLREAAGSHSISRGSR